MNRDAGSKSFPIWLIADSSPPRWEEHLRQPLDPRHPARHNIWTPILEGIQGHLFQAARSRIDNTDLYVRNAVHNAADKPPDRRSDWPSHLAAETPRPVRPRRATPPRVLLTFGAVACEFTRRSLDRGPPRAISHWTSIALGKRIQTQHRTLRPHAHRDPSAPACEHRTRAFPARPPQFHGTGPCQLLRLCRTRNCGAPAGAPKRVCGLAVVLASARYCKRWLTRITLAPCQRQLEYAPLRRRKSVPLARRQLAPAVYRGYPLGFA